MKKYLLVQSPIIVLLSLFLFSLNGNPRDMKNMVGALKAELR